MCGREVLYGVQKVAKERNSVNTRSKLFKDDPVILGKRVEEEADGILSLLNEEIRKYGLEQFRKRTTN